MRLLSSSSVLASLWCSCVLALGSTDNAQWRATTHDYQANKPACSESQYNFERKIERVAVIGAGPSGLQRAATLIEHGFQVRLFERAPRPGGEWLYSDETPVSAPFP